MNKKISAISNPSESTSELMSTHSETQTTDENSTQNENSTIRDRTVTNRAVQKLQQNEAPTGEPRHREQTSLGNESQNNPILRPANLPLRRNPNRQLGKWITRTLLICLIAAGGWGIFRYIVILKNRPADLTNVPTAKARITTLTDKVVEQGELESQSSIDGVCEIDDYENKIIFLAPEGSVVEKDQVVVKFDTSKITEEISERESQVNQAIAEVEASTQLLKVQEDENIIAIRTAKQTLEFAKLDLKKYQEGDYLVNKSDIEGTISEAQTAVDKARRDMENMRALVKRGFREFEQLREAQQVVNSAELRLKSAEQKLDSLERFEHVKSLAEFSGKAEEAEHLLKIAETTAEARLAQAQDKLKNAERSLKHQRKRLEKNQEDLAKHEMKAPQIGTLAYARDNWRGTGEKVHEGSIIYQNQPVYVLPDMTRMQVKVGIHETLVSKIKPKQKAIVRVDAYSGMPLRGTVESVSPLSASTRWEPSNNYSVVVMIDSFGDELKLKPGMTAEVEIFVGEYPNVVAVPIQAVTSVGNKKHVFVKNADDQFEPREIEIGKSNLSFVAVKTGLKENEVVALDAYQRGLAEFGTSDEDEPQSDMFEPDTIDNIEVAVDSESINPISDSATQDNAAIEAETEVESDAIAATKEETAPAEPGQETSPDSIENNSAEVGKTSEEIEAGF